MASADYLLELETRKTTLQATNARIDQTIVELTAQKAANTTEIANIDGFLAYASAGYPAITKLATPGSLTAVATATVGVYTTVMDWADVTNATAYVVERSLLSDYSDAIEIYNSSTSAHTDDGSAVDPDEDIDLTHHKIYYYRVKATAAGYESSDWAPVQVDMFEQLAEAQDIVLTPGDTEVQIDWSDVQFAMTYDIYRHTANTFGSATKVGSDVAVNTYLATGLTNETPYYFWIVAKGTTRLNSDPAAAGSATPMA